MFSLRSVLRGPRAAARSRYQSSQRSTVLACVRSISFVEPLEERRLLAFSAALVADISGPASSSPSSYAQLGDTTLFMAYSDGAKQLWKTDGTDLGTTLVKDFGSGPAPSGLGRAILLEGALYCLGDDLVWRVDGTSEGTQIIADPTPGAALAAPIDLVILDGALYFSAFSNGNSALWKSDGTVEGTAILKNFGSASNRPVGLTTVEGTLFFTAGDSTHGRELWSSDGTAEGTAMVLDINPGTASLLSTWRDTQMLAIGDILYFRASDGVHGEELWLSDGTAAGTVLVKDILPGSAGSNLRNLTSLGGAAYFLANDGTHGEELWRSEGTDGATHLIEDIHAGSASAFTPFPNLTALGNALYFYANDGNQGLQVWKTDGTSVGTEVFSTVNAQLTEDLAELPANMLPMSGLDDVLVFTTFDPVNGFSLWSSQGTVESTTRLVNLPSQTSFQYPIGFGSGNGRLFFAAADVDHGRELWTTDGTTVGTGLLKDLNTGTDGQVDLSGQMLPVGAITYFVASTSNHGSELWRTDGTPAGTFLVRDLGYGAVQPDPNFLTEMNGIVYFTAEDGVGRELWRTDGTEAGTWRVSDIRAGNGGSEPSALTNIRGTLYFWANDGIHGQELWKSDGTDAGTVLVKDIHPGQTGNALTPIVNSAGTLLFFADDGVHGSELWRSNGTETGTYLVKDINSGPGGAAGSVLLTAGSVTYLSANDGAHGRELWRTDGTTAGTVLVEDIQPGAASSNPQNLVRLRESVYFTAIDGIHGREVWSTLIGSSEAELLADLNKNGVGTDNDFSKLWNVGERLYLKIADFDGKGYVAVTNGDIESVQVIAELYPSSLINVGGTAVLLDSGGLDAGLYTTDGTVTGTIPVDGPFGWVYQLLPAKDLAFFTTQGSEPWVLAPPVVARLFYNNSAFDQVAGASGDADDAALAVDKLPYIPGNGRATGENVSSYSKGINGLFIDLAPGHGEISAEDFAFRMGTSTDPSGWSESPAPISITVRADAGIAGHDRVEIVFADGAIKNTWLEVTVRGNDVLGGFHTNSGLDASSVFYFGSRVGDTFTGNSAAAAVTSAADTLQIRAAGGTFAASGNRFDINRDGIVSAGDELLARFNPGLLLMLDLPALSDPPASPTALAATPTADPLSSAVASALAGHVDLRAAASSHASELIDLGPATAPLRPIATARQAAALFADEALLGLTEGESLDETAAEENDRLLDALLSLS